MIITEILEVKKIFIENFQKKVLQGRKLLMNANHQWADKLFNDLYFEIEKAEWLDVQRKNQLIMIIINSWHIYINSLTKKEEGEEKFDPIKYLDAYNRFFTFLSKLDDFYHFSIFFTNLLKSFISMDNLSKTGITKFINSFCNHVHAKENYLDLVELQILLMYLRQSVIPTDLFIFSMEHLSKIVIKLKPDKRTLFINIFLENISIKYNLMEGQEFVKIISKLLVNRLPSSLKGEFGKLARISINERTFPTILADLEELVHYLNNIGEHTWIIMVIRYIYSKINEYQSFPEAINYIRKYIDFLINRSQFDVAFNIYDFMEDLFIYKSELGYSNILVELWIEACKKFINIKEKKFLLQSLYKLNTHLKIPRTPEQIFHFFHTCNYLWQFKSLYYSLEPSDFWRMIFYRALFEEKDFSLSSKIVPFLDKNLHPSLSDLNELYNATQSFKEQIYRFDTNDLEEIDQELKISKVIFHVSSKGLISYRIMSIDGKILEGKIFDEFWNDAQISDLYDDLFSFTHPKKYNFEIMDFGRIYYLMMPKLIRKFISMACSGDDNQVPQFYVVLDTMTIPLELIHQKKYMLLQNSISYRVGELDIAGIPFTQEDPIFKGNYDVLIIDATNNTYPTKWNEKQQAKEVIYPFNEGKVELEHIIHTFKNSEKVNSLNILTGSNCTRENILSILSNNKINIIHFIGNIHYSKRSPKDSYFITEDKEIIKIDEISREIDKNPQSILPFLFFDAQIFDNDGIKIDNNVKILGELFSYFSSKSVKGILSRSLPIFTDDTRNIIADFYHKYLNKHNQGDSLLKALSKDHSKQNIEKNEELMLTSFILFGTPWKIL